MENAKLYQKLVNTKGYMSVKEDNKSYLLHKKHVEHMSKAMVLEHQCSNNQSPERDRSFNMSANS